MTTREKQREYDRRWREKNPEHAREYARNWVEQNREKVREAGRRYEDTHPERRAAASSTKWQKLRKEFFEQYGSKCGGTCDGSPCAWSVTDIRVLTLAHLFNDGAAHRKRVGGSGTAIVSDLRKRGWPKDEGIATQCANCQQVDRSIHVKPGPKARKPKAKKAA